MDTYSDPLQTQNHMVRDGLWNDDYPQTYEDEDEDDNDPRPSSIYPADWE